MKHLFLISALLFSFNASTDEWSAYIYPSSNESRYIGRFETKEDCQAKAECYIEKTNVGSLLDIIFANKIDQGSFECILTEQKETEKSPSEIIISDTTYIKVLSTNKPSEGWEKCNDLYCNTFYFTDFSLDYHPVFTDKKNNYLCFVSISFI